MIACIKLNRNEASIQAARVALPHCWAGEWRRCDGSPRPPRPGWPLMHWVGLLPRPVAVWPVRPSPWHLSPLLPYPPLPTCLSKRALVIHGGGQGEHGLATGLSFRGSMWAAGSPGMSNQAQEYGVCIGVPLTGSLLAGSCAGACVAVSSPHDGVCNEAYSDS